MTLIVYKKGELAGDSRGTFSSVIFNKDDHCAHCAKEACVVDDVSTKITLAAHKDIKFRGDKVLAVGQAGNRALSKRLIGMLLDGKDLEEAYKTYRTFLIPNAENAFTCAFLICCENKNYILDIVKKGNLNITAFEKSELLVLGSSVRVAEWIDALMPDSTAASIINLIMVRDKSVGGSITKVDLTQPALRLITHEKTPPEKLFTGVKELFAMGKAAAKKTTPRKAPTRKATAKTETTT